MREYLFTAAMLALEALVLVHWFVLRESAVLAAVALGAASMMTVMAALDTALLVGVLRRDPAVPQERAELLDLAHIEPLWACVTVLQVAFIGGAYAAGVYWIAVILTCGQGAELAAVAWARWQVRRGLEGPGAVAS